MNIEVTREEARLLLSAINMFNDDISEQYAWNGSSQEMKMMCLLDKLSSNLRDLLAQQPQENRQLNLENLMLYIVFTLIAVQLFVCGWFIYEMKQWFKNGR